MQFFFKKASRWRTFRQFSQIFSVFSFLYTVFKRKRYDDITKSLHMWYRTYLFTYPILCIHVRTIFRQIFYDVNMPCDGCQTKHCLGPLKQNFTAMKDLIGFSRGEGTKIFANNIWKTLNACWKSSVTEPFHILQAWTH